MIERAASVRRFTIFGFLEGIVVLLRSNDPNPPQIGNVPSSNLISLYYLLWIILVRPTRPSPGGPGDKLTASFYSGGCYDRDPGFVFRTRWLCIDRRRSVGLFQPATQYKDETNNRHTHSSYHSGRSGYYCLLRSSWDRGDLCMGICEFFIVRLFLY